MGQYHILINKDRKEYVHAHRIGLGLKLMEQCRFAGSTADALWLLLANSNGRGGGDAEDHPLIGSWAGDRIVVQGDYARPTDRGYVRTWDETEQINLIERDYTDISEQARHLIKCALGVNRQALQSTTRATDGA